MKNTFIKFSIAMFVVISLFALTACGGGGGGSSSQLPPTTANVKVTIPGNLFDNTIPTDARAVQTVQTLKIQATPYLDGVYVKDSEHPPITGEAKVKDYDYVAKLSGLSKSYDYRFAVLFGEGNNERELLKNHVGVASITEGASFNVNIDSTLKTLAYEKWIETKLEGLSNDTSYNTFVKNSAEAGYKTDNDFTKLFDPSVYSLNSYKESLIKITTTDQEAFLPSSSDVDISKIPTSDNQSDNPENPKDPENPTDPMVVGKIGDFELRLVTKDTGYTYEGISHNSTYKSTTAWYKVNGETEIPANLVFLYKTDDVEKFTSYDIMQERYNKDGGSGIIPTNILEVSDCYAVIRANQPNKYFNKDLDDEYYETGNKTETFSVTLCWSKGISALLGYSDNSDPNNNGNYCDVNAASMIAGKYIAISPKLARHEDTESNKCKLVATNTIAVYTHSVNGNGNEIANYLYYNDFDSYKHCKLSQTSNGNCYLAVTSNNNDLAIYNLDNSPKTPVVSCKISGDLQIFNCLSDGSFFVETPSNSYIIKSSDNIVSTTNTSHSGCFMDDSGYIYRWYSAKNDILQTTGLNDQVTLAECETSLNGILDLVIDKNSNKKTIYVW